MLPSLWYERPLGALNTEITSQADLPRDLTVPFARYLAMNKDIQTIKRYHIAKVWLLRRTPKAILTRSTTDLSRALGVPKRSVLSPQLQHIRVNLLRGVVEAILTFGNDQISQQ